MTTITKPSKRFALLFRVFFYAYPILMLCLWLWSDFSDTGSWSNFGLAESILRGHTIQPVTTWQRIACFGASMLTGGAIMYVLRMLSRLFALYSRGEFFGVDNVACYRAIGIGLIVQQALSLPQGALQSVILSFTNPQGQRFISISVDDANISLVVVGLMVILISRIMDEGRKLQEEQQFTV
ncbi:DUF2975 domain-containing protein [Halodesulfovibrio spirochaetisodalis]|uniref:DUF2975 domain-containing protein n=1 Tax=Halodesulfovibrio spirochaetisodalis TaxID=1560234 RepID=UPI000834D2C9|nr:DUF2975 domain-containing protein [Halodesulfovibrio spirochaetisodalis]